MRDLKVWTTSVILEVMFQRKFIDTQTYKLISTTRKARNALAHRGALPDRQQAISGFEGVLRLLSLAKEPGNPVRFEPVQKTVLDYLQKMDQRPKEISTENIICWIELPPLPGENGWKGAEYEKVFVDF
jgi:hypothetical protein